jgi:hypothetical protein
LECTPAELVAGTELEPQFATAWATREESNSGESEIAFARSERIVAVEEAYKRLQAVFDLLLDANANYRGDAENERYYQYGARILRRALDAARGSDSALGPRVHVPDSIMEPTVANDALRLLMTKSLAYIQSLLLEFPEADTSIARTALVARLGLAAVDKHLASFRSGTP